MSYITIVVSSTENALWSNRISDIFMKVLREEIPEFNLKKAENEIKRDDIRLIRSFKRCFGNDCERCEYASFQYIKEYYINSYSIKRLACYGNAYYPEYVEINKREFLLLLDREVNKDEKRIILNDTVYLDSMICVPVSGERYPYAPMHNKSSLNFLS